MRKSFTRLFSLFILICMVSFQVVAQVASPTLSPADGYANVKPDAAGVTFTLTFAENVFPGSTGAGVIGLTNQSDVQIDPIQINGTTSTNLTTGSSVEFSGKKVIITIKTTLVEGQQYYITCTPDAVMNGAGAYYTGLKANPGGTWGATTFLTGGKDYDFKIGDYTDPIVATNGFDPKDGSSAVATSKIYSVTFSEPIQAGTGNVAIYKADGNVVEMYDITSATATAFPVDGALGILGTKLYINPTDGKLAELKDYYVRIWTDAITDVSVNKNKYAGINDNITWNFKLEDLTAPTIAFTPNGGTDIQQGQTMKMTFSDNRTAAGLSFELKEVYTTPGTPKTIASNANVQAYVIFQEDLTGTGTAYANVATANYTAKYTAANEITIVFTTGNKFATGAKYKIGIAAASFADVENNVIASTTKEFTAGDFTPPIASNVYLQQGGYSGAQVAPFSLNNTAADKETTKIYFGVKTDDVSTPASGLGKLPTTINYIVQKSSVAAITSVATVKAGTELPRITNQNDKHQAYITTDKDGATLESNTSYTVYYVITDNATVKNTSAIFSATVLTNDIDKPVPTITFKNTAGTVTYASTAVDEQAKIVIDFDEDVVDNGGTNFTAASFAAALELKFLGTSPATTLAYNAAPAANDQFSVTVVSNKKFEINGSFPAFASAEWRSKGNYTVKIKDNMVYDKASFNPPYGTRNGISGHTAQAFTVKDYEGPTVVISPANGAVNFDNNGNITITFSETPYYLGNPVSASNVDNVIELRKGNAATATTSSLLEPRTVSISGNVVTIVPANKPLDSEIYYRAAVSTDITDVNGYKLNMYKGNVTAIAGELEYSVFKTKDNRTPLVTYTTYDPTVDVPPLAANGARTSQGTANVVNNSLVVVLLDESVREIASNTAIVNMDPNQIRTLISLKKNDASGDDIEFNVIHAQMNTSLTPPAAGKFEIVLDPIDYPSTYTFDNAGTYYVEISGIEDAADNAINSNSTFTIADTTPLTITAITPGNTATGIAKSGNVVITFNQNIRKETTSGTFYLYIDANGIAPWDVQVDVTNVAVSASGNQVTIPYSGLASNTTYGMQVDANAFIALANGAKNAISSTTFTTVDEVGPTIDFVAANLSDDNTTANSVKITGDKLTALFTEDIVLGYGVIKLRKPEAAGATLIADINVQSSSVNVNNTNKKIVEITLPGTLAYNSSYFLEIPITAFKDAAGNNFTWADSDHAIAAGQTTDITAPSPIPVPYVLGTATWDFQTELDATPTMTSYVPAAGADDVAVGTTLGINFSEAVSLATSGIRKLTIYDAQTTPASEHVVIDLSTATLAWTNGNKTVTITNTAPLLADHDYYVGITAGAFVDATGNATTALTSTVTAASTPLAGTGWYFTTRDLTAPSFSVAASSGAALTAVGLSDNLIVTFTEPIVLVAANWNTAFTTSTGTLSGGFSSASLAADNVTLTLNPATNFASQALANLTLSAGAVRDMATTPNTNAAKTVALTGEDKTAPGWNGGFPVAVAPYSKSKAKVNVDLDEKCTVYYHVTITGALSSNPSAATVKLNGSSYSYTTANATKSIELTGLAEFTGYDVYLVGEDSKGNQNTVKKVTVNTLDETDPYILSLTPTNGQMDVNYNHVSPAYNGVVLKMIFNERMQFGSAPHVYVRKYDTNVLVFDATNVASTPAGSPLTLGNSATGKVNDMITVTIPKTVLQDKTQYYIEFDYNLATDWNNTTIASAVNKFDEAFIGKADWSFTTADETVPTLLAPAGSTALIPKDGAVDVSVVAPGTLKMRFSEPIKTQTGSIYIYRAGTATPHEIINVTSTDVVVNPANSKELLITYHNKFASEVQYYVLLANTCISDLAPVPNYFAGIAATQWDFWTADVTKPIVAIIPTNGTNNVLTTATITAQFQDPRQKELAGVTVPEQIYNNSVAVANGADLKAWFSATANGSAVSIASAIYNVGAGITGHTVTVTLTGGLKGNTSYTLNFNPPSTASDDKGNSVDATSVNFSTVDDTSPTITFSPTHNSTNVGVADGVVIEFSKIIYNYTAGPNANYTPTATDLLSANYVTFKTSPGGVAVPYTVEVLEAGKKYKLKPNASLASTSTYEVIWTANAGSAQEVYDRIILPNANKLNQTAAKRTTKFTTEDTVKPSVTAMTPTGTLANPAAAVKLTFTEKVVAGTGTLQIRYANGQIFTEVDASACTYSTSAPWTVTIPHPNFLAFTGYYVLIPEGAITDASSNKNKYVGINNNTTWTFTTDDGTAPSVTSYTPASGSNDIPVYSDLKLTFDENINVAAGNIVIYYNNGDPGYDGNAVEIIPIGSTKVEITGSDVANNKTSDIITIDPTTTFDKLGTYYVRIDKGTVTDFATITPNDYAGINDNTTWYFTITDNTRPTLDLTQLSPAANATGVEANPDLVMVFDRDVMEGTGAVKLFEYFYNTSTNPGFYEEKLIESIDINSGQVTISGNTITVDPSVTLDDNTTYYVLIENTAITNTASSKDQFAGVSNPFTWRFNTGDNTAPTVSADVASGTTGLANSFDVTLTFSETVVSAAAGITVTGGTGTPTITEETVGTVYKVSITADDLATVVITADATIVDATGNALAETAFTYNVADNNGPTLMVDVADGTTVTSNMFDVVLTFNEDVTGVDAAVSVSAGTVTVTGSGAVYTASIDAPSSTDVVLTVANTVVDLAANTFAGATYTYTVTGDTDAPMVAALSPENGATLADAHPDELVMTFDEDVVAGAGMLYIYNGATVEWSFDITDSAVSIDGDKVTITLANSLDKNITYFVYVDAGFVTDTYGNAYAGINSPTAWTFTTGDFKTGIDPVIGSLELKVYPNPFVNELRIDNASELSRVVITSMTGQKVKEIVRPNSTIQTNELRSGVYFISMYVDDVVAKTERIVKR